MSGPAVGRRTVGVPPEVAVLAPFVEAGLFGPFEVQLAASLVRLHRLEPAPDDSSDSDVGDEVVLAIATAASAPRFGHVCVDLARFEEQIGTMFAEGMAMGTDALPWPRSTSWLSILGDSALVWVPGKAAHDRIRPLVLDGTRLYLQRYWHDEVAVAADLTRRARRADGVWIPDRPELEAVLDELFGADDVGSPDLQRAAVRRAMTAGVSIVAGGPGTGKTHMIARLLAAALRCASDEGRTLDICLAAPTGKAAQRMRDAVLGEVPGLSASGSIGAEIATMLAGTQATTIHRLLGWLPGSKFVHDRENPLPCQMVVVDETSMVPLSLMARLLEGVSPEARLVLVGDPFQLASIEAGTVLGDLVGPNGAASGTGGPSAPEAARRVPDAQPLADRVTVFTRMHRFGADSAIAELAEQIRRGDPDRVVDLLRAANGDGRTEGGLRWVLDSDAPGLDAVLAQLVEVGVDLVTCALEGDGEGALSAAARCKLLAATRRGPLGLYEWGERIETGVAGRVPSMRKAHRWYVGRPIIVTENDPVNQVANGDVGVVVARNGGMEVALRGEDGLRWVAPSRLDRVENLWAMTIHKSQGSEYPHAVVSLPRVDAPILTRELVYTAVTRAREQLTIVGSEASIRQAVDRPVTRASGLRERLWSS